MIAFVSATAWRECIVYTVYYTLNYGLYLAGYEDNIMHIVWIVWIVSGYGDNIMHIYKVSSRLLFGLEMRLNIFFTLSIRY